MSFKGTVFFGLALGLVVYSTQFAPVAAQSGGVVDSSDIIRGLTVKNTAAKPKTMGLTRGLTRSFKPNTGKTQSGLNQADKDFLNSISTRGIKITLKEKEKVYEIVDKGGVSTYDFEINFEFGSAEISPDSMPQLLELGKALGHESLVNSKLMLVGHTDAVGSRFDNQHLSEARANSIAAFLSRFGGVDAGRLLPIGYGEDRLKNSLDGNAAENRRVEVINITAG